MAAGITDHCWTVQELLSLHVPPTLDTPQAAWAPLMCAETPDRAVVLMTTVNCGATYAPTNSDILRVYFLSAA